jgi:hypothetical protein
MTNTAASAARALSSLAGQSSARVAKQAQTAQAAQVAGRHMPAHRADPERGPSPATVYAGPAPDSPSCDNEVPRRQNDDILPAKQKGFLRLLRH